MGKGTLNLFTPFSSSRERVKAYARFEKRYNDAMALDEEEATLSSELMQKRR